MNLFKENQKGKQIVIIIFHLTSTPSRVEFYKMASLLRLRIVNPVMLKNSKHEQINWNSSLSMHFLFISNSKEV